MSILISVDDKKIILEDKFQVLLRSKKLVLKDSIDDFGFYIFTGTDDVGRVGEDFCYVLKEIRDSREEKLNYFFIDSPRGLDAFYKNKGVLTVVTYKGIPVAFNLSILRVEKAYTHLTFGLSLAHAQFCPTHGVMEYMSRYYISYALLKSLRSSIFVVDCMLNCAVTLGEVDKVCDRFCYPVRGEIAGIGRRFLNSLLNTTFITYIEPNFPGAELFENLSLIRSSKESIGFRENHSTFKKTYNSKSEMAILSRIKDFSTEDIVVLGDLYIGRFNQFKVIVRFLFKWMKLKFYGLKKGGE